MVTVVAAGAAIALAVPGAQATGTPGWRVATPVYPSDGDGMMSVAASSATDAWAVGESGSVMLITHWNGKKWQTLNAPVLAGNPYMSAAVASMGRGRAWFFMNDTNEELGITSAWAFEWTGRSWADVHYFGSLVPGALAASGPDNAWGFGTDSAGKLYAVHDNGKGWTRVASPLNVTQSSGSAAAGVWVTGTVIGQPARVAILHWSNGVWRTPATLPTIAVPAGDQMSPGLIAAATATDVWASVSVGPASGSGTLTNTLLHWNGKSWSKLAVPALINQHGLQGLASDGHGGSWAATYKVNKPGVSQSGLLMYHYSAGRWTSVAVPGKSGQATYLGGNMELVPGTRSLLAPGYLGDAFWAAILTYGL